MPKPAAPKPKSRAPSIPKKKAVLSKEARGRPTSYLKDYDDLVFKLCLLGATDVQLAEAFDVSVRTIDAWKLKYRTFSASLRAGKLKADAYVANALYQRAIGSVTSEQHLVKTDKGHEIVTIEKEHPPETNAAKFWLKC